MHKQNSVWAGVPEGSPLSPILYIYYNADLPMVPNLALGFIDDIAYGTSGQTAEENIENLTTLLQKGEDWRQCHGAQFETSTH